MRKAFSLVFVLAVASLSLAACSHDDDETTTSPAGGSETTQTTTGGQEKGAAGTTLQLAADPSELMYDKGSLEAEAGPVTIEFTNPSAIGHDVVIEQGGKDLAKTEVITQSEATLTADLQPGTYVFYCSVPGHKDSGMQGTLDVK